MTKINHISLTLALIDVEVANGRVMDLNKRLISVKGELAQARRELSKFEGSGGVILRLRSSLFKIRAIVGE